MNNTGCYPGCYYYTDSCFRKDCIMGKYHDPFTLEEAMREISSLRLQVERQVAERDALREECAKEYERGRRAGITQVYDTELARKQRDTK